MEEDQNMWSEMSTTVRALVFSWGLAGPVTDFDCGNADMGENPAECGAPSTPSTNPVSANHLVINAMARQSTNPSRVDSAPDDSMAGTRRVPPKHDADPCVSDGRVLTVVPSSLQVGMTPDAVCMSVPGSAAPALDIFELPRTNLCERHRRVDDDLDDEGLGTDDNRGLRFREKSKTKVATTTGVLGEGGSTNGINRNPAVRAPTSVDTTSRAVGYKADMLVAPSAHRGSDQLLSVPSVQQESTAVTVQEELASVEGSGPGVTRSESDRMVQEEAEVYSIENGEVKATKNNIFYIPKRLKVDYKLFLKATSEDFERGNLHVVRCKLCPEVNFKTWDHFTRHCKTAEPHPLELFFCDHCGDFFARSDSLERHYNYRASECCGVAQHEAEAKRMETMMIHKEFVENTKAFLKTNQGIWTPFAQIMKEKYPNSSKRSKRGIGQQSCLQAPKSMSS